jgi:hypothetical protein
MKLTSAKFIAAAVAAGALILVVPGIRIYTDRAFVDVNTGSRKGHREWFTGWRSGEWYQESAVEAFMRASHPEEMRQKWVSYAGTGRNILGSAISHGHGRPGPIVFLKPEQIANHCSRLTAAEKHDLYATLSGGDEAQVKTTVERILEACMAEEGPPRNAPDPQPQGGAGGKAEAR